MCLYVHVEKGKQEKRERLECVCVCEHAYLARVSESSCGCLRVRRQTPSGQSQIKSPHLFVAFEEDCMCHLPGGSAMLT